jgi:hypothetical protein
LNQARDQSIQIVRAARTDLGAEGVNDVDLKYAALQSRANDYLGLVVEAVTTDSFNPAKSQQDGMALKKAIDGFNGSLEPLLTAHVPGQSAPPARAALPLSDGWVDSMQMQLAAAWPRYRKQLAAMSNQQRSMLAEQLKHRLAWPDFQAITQ